MRATRPRVYEYHLAAIADYIYAVAGTRGGGYRPIVASGANIWHPHYFRNSAPLEPGELVLMDYAPDVGNYTSDIGRMWPVDGKYRPWQRELYGFVVEYHKTLLELIRPGLTAQQIHAEAAARMRPVIEARRWSKPSFRQGAEGMLQFAGHLSHGVGMAVHDVGDYKARPLEPGVVFALDPQMWVPEGTALHSRRRHRGGHRRWLRKPDPAGAFGARRGRADNRRRTDRSHSCSTRKPLRFCDSAASLVAICSHPGISSPCSTNICHPSALSTRTPAGSRPGW